MLLRDYPKGSDLTLINTVYTYPKKDHNGKYDKGYMTIVYRDNVTKEIKKEEIEDPDYEYYILKQDQPVKDYNELFIEKDKVDKVSVPYRELEKDIATKIGAQEFYYENIRLGNRYANKQLHTDTRLFNSDMNIEDHYRFRFSKEYTNNIFSPTKAFFDIEVDIIDVPTDRFVDPGEAPINAITIVLEEINKTYTLLLRNPKNPLIQEFEDSINNDLFTELKSFIREKVGGWKNEIRFGLDKMEYEFMFYDEEDEIKLIQDLFNIVNIKKPTFVLAWNIGFDLPYIIKRIENLGYRPEDIVCHPDFNIKKVSYFLDERNKNEFAERGDFATISSYSIFIDQMIQFASRRKGQGMFRSFALDYIGEMITGVRKLDYSHITSSLAKLPYKDYKTFVFYNIMDTVVQKCIETKVNDINYIFNKCLINNTRYNKGHRQTVYLTNRGNKEFYNSGFIMGNNFNRGTEKPKVKFPGAFVADPGLISDYAKTKINGIPISVFGLLDDYDYKSLYPSNMREFNIAHNTMIGKIEIINQIFENENRFNNENFDRGGKFIEDFHSHNWITFCNRWLKLADYSTLYEDIKYFFMNIKLPQGELNSFNRTNGLLNAIEFHKKGLLQPCIRPIEFINPIELYKKPNFEKLNEIYNGGV